MLRPTQAHIDLDRLAANFKALRAHHVRGRLMTVLKADGYGHGMLPAAHLLQSLGHDLFAVAIIEEAQALRASGIGGRILVLGPPDAAQMPLYAQAGVEMTIPSLAHMDLLARAGLEGETAIHIKVDTGMGRIGMRPGEVAEALRMAEAVRGVRVVGVYSHFAESEKLRGDYTGSQFQTLNSMREAVDPRGHMEWHVANSAGMLRDALYHLDYARVGFALWAPMAFDPPQEAPPVNSLLRPVMRLHTRVSFIKQAQGGETLGYSRTYTCGAGEWIATLPIGYGDGFFRGLSNRGQVWIGGRACPIVGNVSMDQTLVSLGGTPAALGDEAVLMGDSAPGLDAAGMGRHAGTIDYEVFTHLNQRIPRVFSYNGREGTDWREVLGLQDAPQSG